MVVATKRKSKLVATNNFVATNMFVATSILLSRQKTCFVASVCRVKSFVATKIILVAAPANEKNDAISSALTASLHTSTT